MKLLLDSNVLLWAVYSPNDLTERARRLLQDPANELIVSHAGIWELLAKIGRGKLLLAGTSVEAAVNRFTDLGVSYLPVELHQLVAAAQLPHHHSDPFDRVIIAQAIENALPVITSDGMFRRYPVEVIWE